MVCVYGMGQCKPPTWAKVGMEIMPGDLNKMFLAKDRVGLSSAFSQESGWDTEFFFLGLVCVIAVVICLWISKRMKQQVNKEKLPEDKGLHEKILLRMGKVEERVEALEEFMQRLNLRKSKVGKMGDQKVSD